MWAAGLSPLRDTLSPPGRGSQLRVLPLAPLGAPWQFWLSRATTAPSPLGIFGCCWGWGSPAFSPGSPSPAISLPPSPAPAADFTVSVRKASSRCLATLGRWRGGLQAGMGGGPAGPEPEPARGDSATLFWGPGPGRLVRDRASRGAGRARESGGGDAGSAGCREHRPPRAPRSSALLPAFVFHGSASALKGRGETPTVTGRKTELN